MTSVLVTIDTELSLAAHQAGSTPADNMNRSVFGRVSDGEWGVAYQSEKLASHGLKAVFFVESLCADVVGLDVLKRIIESILSAGHSVELHVHTEWLPWFPRDPVDGARGRCIADFTYDHQLRLIERAIDNIVKAGAPSPIAFRAGNYGANNDTLRALGRLGLKYDSSYNLPYLGLPCQISADRPLFDACQIEGTTEVPISCFLDYSNHFRPAQICAISASEMRLVIERSAAHSRKTAVIVGHGFELLNRSRTRANRFLVRRFDRLCQILADGQLGVISSDFLDLRNISDHEKVGHNMPLSSNLTRTTSRMIQQALAALIYR